jgi:hypothetical protein
LGARGQSLVEFTLVIPILLVLLVALSDFGRIFATGIMIESATRDAAEAAAQEYLRNPPAPFPSPAPTPGDASYYAAMHGHAVDTLCAETRSLPNAGYALGDCTGVPTIVCVHDGADPACSDVEPPGVTVPAECPSFAAPARPTAAHAGGSETSRYVEVRACYRFSTLLGVRGIANIGLPFGDFYIERIRVFTVADY